MDVFSIVPIEVFIDERLTKTDLRVLGAILSFRNKDTNLCWPKREQIAERCGLPLCKISTATTHLVDLGWLEKSGDGGRSRSTKYKLLVPDLTTKTVINLVTVTKSETVTNPITKTLTDSVTKTVTKSVRGIKQTNEQTIEQTNYKSKPSKSYDVDLLKTYGITGQLSDDFITHRKAKKSSITTTAMNGFQREADKAGITLAEAITVSIERGWQGFKADWYLNKNQSQQINQQRKPTPRYIPPEQRGSNGFVIESTAEKL